MEIKIDMNGSDILDDPEMADIGAHIFGDGE